MFHPSIKLLLESALPVLPQMVMENSLSRDIDDLVKSILPPMKLAVVDDAQTADAFGKRVFSALKGRFPSAHVTLKGAVQADDETVKHLRAQTLSADALIAVGSGTVSDLCKYVSHLDRKPYIMFPTAASMNGYLSANASIASRGHKKTLPAHMPVAVCCDMGVIAAAPARMSKSGLGDSLARPTAQADWLLSHVLLGTPYEEMPFALLSSLEPQVFDQARGIALADPASITLLMKLLLLSGLGMTIAGGSYPASQGEHMIAHTMEMLKNQDPRFGIQGKTNISPFHGEQIGVTALTMARLQEKLLASKPSLRPSDFSSERMIALFGSEAAAQARKGFDGKAALVEHSSAGGAFFSPWDDLLEKIAPVRLSAQKIESILKAAEAPVAVEALGWSDKGYQTAVDYARYTRERFTFLDLCT